MKIYDSEIEKMKNLINYGYEENTTFVNKPIIEHSAIGADGKNYAIIRENNKYYIKFANQKNTEVLPEDYDYIGGFLNRKKYEYESYANASKNFELKLMSINEAFSCNKPIEEEYKKSESSEWQINETKEMKSEIDRQREIMRNASLILNESDNLPDAPASNPSKQKVNQPFDKEAKAILDKDFTKTNSNHETAGSPFDKKETVTNSDMENDKNKTGGDDVNSPHTESPKYAPKNSVAAQKKAGNSKSVKMNESKKVRFSESQVLSWNDSCDYMDKSHGTKIGSSDPFKESQIKEGESMHDKSNCINTPKPGTSEVGDSSPFNDKVNEDYGDYTEYAGMPDDEIPFPEVDDYSESDLEDIDNEYDDLSNIYDEDFDDSVNEETLNDFGKHPAYQKVVMTTPPNVNNNNNGYKDWNDSSVENDSPFGTNIGSSSPFDEMVKMITDSVISKLGGSVQKKKVNEKKLLKVPSKKDKLDSDFEINQNQNGVNNFQQVQDMQDMPTNQEDDFNGENYEDETFDNDFDAGVEADENEDPKKYIQQLSGKLSQSLRKYNDSLQKPDIETNKYAAGMVNNTVAKVLDDSDIDDIIDKMKSDEHPSDENDSEEFDFQNDKENMKNESKYSISEIITDFINNSDENQETELNDDEGYISNIFKTNQFK